MLQHAARSGFERDFGDGQDSTEGEAAAGRPTSYSAEMAEAICGLLATGKTLTAVCGKPGMPGTTTVHHWLGEHEEFRDAYARAREMQAAAIAERGYMEAMKAGTNGIDPASARLRFDAAKWLAGRLAPRTWSDRQQPDIGTTENPMVMLVKQLQGSTLPVVDGPPRDD
jgi:hypothetical protein